VARGWESKSVEEQQAEAELGRAKPRREGPSPEQAARVREREGLLSSKMRVESDIGRATHPRHREQLQEALQFLEAKISALDE
jgi:hypothetical protein